MHDIKEEWKPVVGYEGFYEVSNNGRVRRIYGDGRPPRERKLPLNPKGYPIVSLSKDNIRITYAVHRLVARAFLGERPEGFDINHIDANKLNSKVTNLEYVTRKENIHHSLRLQLADRSKKLSAEAVVEIRNLRGKMTQRQIAALHGIDRGTVQDIQAMRIWKHVPDTRTEAEKRRRANQLPVPSVN